ncbi:MAG: threonine synthase [Synergistetes bacterium]|nr:MAG: Threonine synthase [bacterium 42_11]MBC7331622.1 threonine synthase [Synergistota bacterium]MDK2870763.1 threonine synthase [bacterium]
MDSEGVMRKWRDFLPITDKTPIITLGEGNTPLIRARNIEKEYNLNFELYLKYEGTNPTGSFKDRGMVMAVAKALEEEAIAVACASTGNTSASAAAYAARTGLKCIVIIPKNAIALGKLAQALAAGATVIAIDGNFDDGLRIIRELTQRYPITLVNSLNPYRLEGQKTAAFEICETLGEAPDYLAIPVGNAGNISAYGMGFKEFQKIGKITKTPKLLGFQAEGAAPIVENRVIRNPETIATAIRIGNPAHWQRAVNTVKELGGGFYKVSDEEILEAYKIVVRSEGIFAEPASAASLAGVLKLSKDKFFPDGAKVVSVLTGHGLKDPNIAINLVGEPPSCPPLLEEVIKIAKL